MEHRRTETDDAHRKEYQQIVVGEGKHQQTRKREAHAYGKGVGAGMTVGIQTREGLQDGRSHLKYQRDDAYLGEGEVELVLYYGVDGGDDGLNHVVEEVGNAAYNEHRIHRSFRHCRVSLYLVAY